MPLKAKLKALVGPDKAKALAGAFTGFLMAIANHLVSGEGIETIASSATELLQLGAAALVSAAAGYFIVYRSPKNKDKNENVSNPQPVRTRS